MPNVHNSQDLQTTEHHTGTAACDKDAKVLSSFVAFLDFQQTNN